jgi:hypothetical protein
MIRHKPAPKPVGSNCPALALPKWGTGGPRQAQNARQHFKDAAFIKMVRAWVWARSEGRCRCCGMTERETLRKWKADAFLPHQMHEIIPRSAGRPFTETFSIRNCIRLCAVCHKAVTNEYRGIRMEIVYGPKMAEGYMEFRRLVLSTRHVLTGEEPSDIITPVRDHAATVSPDCSGDFTS